MLLARKLINKSIYRIFTCSKHSTKYLSNKYTFNPPMDKMQKITEITNPYEEPAIEEQKLSPELPIKSEFKKEEEEKSTGKLNEIEIPPGMAPVTR